MAGAQNHMEKITAQHPLSQSSDLVKENIETLKRLFPTIAKEGKIDFNELKALLDEEVETGEEYYRFTWAGKSEARREANKPSTATLRPNKADSKNWDSTGNIFIEGDNLEVLKLLQKSYAGKVKMIYIDPPYNTGKDFVYKDNYSDNLRNYLALTGQTDQEGKKLSSNPESDGRYHSNWLNMMYPRLKLARNLLTDDGVVFTSIDNNEVCNLHKICDEIYGNENFMGYLVLQTATDNNPSQINTEHEYMICYSKDKNNLGNWYSINEAAEKIKNKYYDLKKKYIDNLSLMQDELRTWIKLNKDKLPKSTHYDNIDERGVFHDGDIANTRLGGYKYEVLHPTTKKPCKIPDKGFRYPESTMKEMIDSQDIMFGIDENTLIKPKKRIEDAKDLLRSIIYEDGRASTKVVDSLLTKGVFENPKSHFFGSKLLSFVTKGNDIILDFFAGSGTTAHSILQQNAKDLGNRKFICVQLPEPTDEKSEAFKAGYTNIAEICKERIRRAGSNILNEKKLELEKLEKSIEGKILQEDTLQQIVALKSAINNLDIGFKAFKLDSSNILAWDGNIENFESNLLNSQNNIKVNRTEEDVLFEILLKYGLDLTVAIEEKDIELCKVYSIGNGKLFVCLSDRITTGVADAIGKWKEELHPSTCRVLFKDNGFQDDIEKTNSIQILKQYGIEEANSI